MIEKLIMEVVKQGKEISFAVVLIIVICLGYKLATVLLGINTKLADQIHTMSGTLESLSLSYKLLVDRLKGGA